MATLEDVRRALDKDELDYPGLAKTLGADAVGQLRQLVAEDDPRIAPRASYLAALIGGPGSDEAVRLAAGSRHVAVRVAAAAAIDKLSADGATGVAERLLADPDIGIRARATKSASRRTEANIKQLVERVAKQDKHPDVRALAAKLAKPAARAKPT